MWRIAIVLGVLLLAGAILSRATDASGDVDFDTLMVKRGSTTAVWTAGGEYLDWLQENGLQDTAATKVLFQQKVLTSS